jgi:transcription factor E2F7/8
LGLLSTGFIRLFFGWREVISLEQAARKLSSETIEDNKIKTKIRRLYDIANVFSSLGLIKKTSLESKKPAFQWIGLSGLDKFIERLHASHDEREIFQERSCRKSD